MSACDAVVTVSNTTAHLAGALGRPIWVLVPYGRAQFWYWFKRGDDMPWYPQPRGCGAGPSASRGPSSWHRSLRTWRPRFRRAKRPRSARRGGRGDDVGERANQLLDGAGSLTKAGDERLED